MSRAWTWTSKSKSVWANGVSFQAINLNLSPLHSSGKNLSLVNIPSIANIVINKIKQQLIKKLVLPAMDDWPLPHIPSTKTTTVCLEAVNTPFSFLVLKFSLISCRRCSTLRRMLLTLGHCSLLLLKPASLRRRSTNPPARHPQFSRARAHSQREQLPSPAPRRPHRCPLRRLRSLPNVIRWPPYPPRATPPPRPRRHNLSQSVPAPHRGTGAPSRTPLRAIHRHCPRGLGARRLRPPTSRRRPWSRRAPQEPTSRS